MVKINHLIMSFALNKRGQEGGSCAQRAIAKISSSQKGSALSVEIQDVISETVRMG